MDVLGFKNLSNLHMSFLNLRLKIQRHFQRCNCDGEETVVYLRQPVPVHLIYRTAFVDELGVINYRRDIYGRDAAIYEALINAGVQAESFSG